MQLAESNHSMAANDVPCCQAMFWTYLLISMGLVLFAGLMSGLTLGLMSLSLVDLEVLAVSGQPKDRKNAAKILPVVKNQHLLLCTLLLGNSLAMEALPIFLDSILPAWVSILISVTLILAFGEIIPQAMCSRYGLSIGAKMVVVVHLLVWVFFPVTYPISKLLDWLLGKRHLALFRRAELRTFVGLHENAAGKGGELSQNETTIITGALDLSQKTAKDAMTPIQKTFSLDINSKLDMRTLGLITSKGHSRVPIYSGNPTNIIGLILVKNLITCSPEDEIPIRKASVRRIPRVPDHLPLYEILNEFQKGNSHMAVVVKGMKDVKKTPGCAIGKPNMLDTRVHTRAEQKASNSSPVLEVIAEASPVGTPNSNLRNDVQNRTEVQQLFKEWDKKSATIIDTDLESLPNHPREEEIIGIITMEDVIEELLQEEIYDETDEYNNVHHKIRMNMLHSRRSSPRSSRATPHYNFQQRTPFASPLPSYHHTPIATSHFQQQTPVASPLSSYHHTPIATSHFQQQTPVASPLSSYHLTPIFRSPVPSYVQSPGAIPSLSNSPGNYFPTSPAEFPGSPGQVSPATTRVSRKPYEKLSRLEDGV